MAEARHEAAAPGAARSCLLCLGALESPAAVEPCGHVFCHTCIQGRATAAAPCPLCREPIGAIRLLQGQEGRAGVAPRRRLLHPFVLRWRQEEQRRQEEHQRGPGGRRRRRFSDGDREPSPPVPLRRLRRELEERPHRVREEELASGDHVRRLPFIPFEPEPPWDL